MSCGTKLIGKKPLFRLLVNHFGNGNTHNAGFLTVISVIGTPSEGPGVRPFNKFSSELSPIPSPLSTGIKLQSDEMIPLAAKSYNQNPHARPSPLSFTYQPGNM